jgi:hypothetical protein
MVTPEPSVTDFNRPTASRIRASAVPSASDTVVFRAAVS